MIALKNSLLLFLVSLLFTACVDFDPREIKNLQDGKVYKIGHGGLGFHRWFPFQALPANSSASFTAALENGADGIELDLQMTKDGEFVLYHDNELQSQTAQEGCIADKKLKDVKGLAYQLGWPFDWFQSERIITLDSLFQLIKSQEEIPFVQIDMRTYSSCFELKENLSFKSSYIKQLHQKLASYSIPEDKLLLISLDKDALKIARKLNSPYIISLEISGDFDQNLQWAINNNIKVVTVKPSLLSPEKSAKAHANGIKVITFGAKSKSGNAKLLRFNPDYIQTDNLSALKDLLGS